MRACSSEEYTSTITTANESEIDTLNISENTKINMYADVMVGKSIDYSNTFVTNGSFTDFYVSYSNTTATYAIRQTPRIGGYTINVPSGMSSGRKHTVEEDGEYLCMRISRERWCNGVSNNEKCLWWCDTNIWIWRIAAWNTVFRKESQFWRGGSYVCSPQTAWFQAMQRLWDEQKIETRYLRRINRTIIWKPSKYNTRQDI